MTRDGPLERPWAFWSAIALATLGGALLRLRGLGSPSFWVDEYFTIARAGADPVHWSRLLGYLPTRLSLWLHDVPLEALRLDGISEWPALGVTEAAARLGPAWVGIVAIPLLAWAARAVTGRSVAAIAALLLAITPWHLYWSQMARYYTLQFLFGSLFVLLFARGLQTGRVAAFVAAGACALAAYLCHPTTLILVAACAAPVGVAWLAGARLPHLGRGAVAALVTGAACGVVLLVRELGAEGPAPLAAFAEQDWDPPLLTLALGVIVRIEPATCVLALGALAAAATRRDPLALYLGCAALLVPLALLALRPFAPIAPRYFFAGSFVWMLLAALWCDEAGRRLRPSGWLAAAAAPAVLLTAVGFDTYLYSRDGAGARARWREAFAYVREHGGPAPEVYAGSRFQAQFYLESDVGGVPRPNEVERLVPGSWVIARSQGAMPPRLARHLDVKARYEIPSKPWSWVLYVMQVPPAEP